MTTMIVRIDGSADVGNIAIAVRQLRGVVEVEMPQTEPFERIPGLPYTKEERMAAVHRAEQDYIAGRFVSSDELRKKHPRT